jgi:hypothetical protein
VTGVGPPRAPDAMPKTAMLASRAPAKANQMYPLSDPAPS